MSETFTYEIVRSKRKSVGITVYPDQRVVVRAPLRVSDAKVRKFVEEKHSWITKQLQKFRENPRETALPPTDEERKWLKTPENKHFLQAVFAEVYASFPEYTSRPMPKLSFRVMTSRWGSCSSDGQRISLNLRLIGKPIECVKYVCIHECAHILHHNHGPQFWQLVALHCPNHKAVRRQLQNS